LQGAEANAGTQTYGILKSEAKTMQHWVVLRRRLGIGALILTLVSFLAFVLSAAQSSNDWSMFRGIPARTGLSSTELPKSLKLRWSYQTKDSIESSAAIAAGTIYVGSMDASLYAIDLDTGKLRWRYATTGSVQESSPCVHNNAVYIGDLNGVFHAVNAATGKVRWTFKADGEIKSSPNCLGDKIYFGSYDQNLYCLSADTGALIWKYSTEGPVHCSPAIDKDTVYISGCDETFRAIDATTGKQRYSVPLGSYTGASAALRDGRAYVGTFGNNVLCVDLRLRAIQWTYSNSAHSFPFYSSAAVTADRVVLGGRDKIIHCLEKTDGKEIWSFQTRGRVESSPLIIGNRVFVGSNDGLLYELDLASGKKIWDFTAGAPLSASPAAVQGSLVIGSQDGILYCFGN
jgi:eukaryotic-like serine/threonine-protein kinase